MPGRVATRAARPSTVSSKSTHSQASCSSAFSPLYPVGDESPASDLRLRICEIFADVQKTTSGHRKHVVRLRKIQEACCFLPAQAKRMRLGSSEDVNETDFNAEVARCALRVLAVKKTEPVGDRIVRFLGLFLKSACEKDVKIFEAETGIEETQTIPETPTSRLTFNILSLLIPLLSAKEKTVRFRSTQIISHVVNSLDSIDDELYHLIRQGLIKRIRDKEPTIRVQAVMGLGRLAGNEMDSAPESDDSDNDAEVASLGLLEKLLDVLQHDTSAEVRRSLLLNLPLTPATLPYLLERARDLDGATRRALYSRLLPSLGDFRHLSLSMREKLLRWGLRDRDENVRKAAARLFRERWIEDCAKGNSSISGEAEGQGEKFGPAQVMSPPSIPALLELLERIDVINSGADQGIALDAMKDFWDGRPDYLDTLTFDDGFWEALTPESAFIARSFNDFCQLNVAVYGMMCEEKMPEVTRLGFYLQKYTNALLEGIKSAAELGGGEEETAEQEFVVEQLLHIAETLDYTDEVGRRKMFGLLREVLCMPDLPEETTRLTVECLRLVCGSDAAGEREFCGVVLEAVAEVHDAIPSDEENAADDSFVSAKSDISGNSAATASSACSKRGVATTEEDEQKAVKEIMINMKCLHIAQCMLQNVDGNLQSNMHLVTMLNNLVVPAVRSHEAPIRERGLFSLGLCCLLDRTLAEENVTLFIHCFSKGHETLQIMSLQILCDILTTHPTILRIEDELTQSAGPMAAFQKPLLKSFTKALKSTSPSIVQSAAATSLAKLLLTSRLNISETGIDDLLKSLVISFFDPRTAENASLRQALAYFLPVYCHSRLENCERVARVAVSIISELLKISDEHYTVEAEEDSDGDVDESAAEKKVKSLMGQVVAMLGDWTDERKVVVTDGFGKESLESGAENSQIQLRLAESLLERTLTVGCHIQERKVLLNLLAKLYVPATVTSDQSQLAGSVKDLLDEAISEGIANDATGRNALVKVKNAVLKIIKGAVSQNSGRQSKIGSPELGEAHAFEDTLVIRGKEAKPVQPEVNSEDDIDSEFEDLPDADLEVGVEVTTAMPTQIIDATEMDEDDLML